MGSEYEVYSNRETMDGDIKQVYAGESFLEATKVMLSEKEKGAKYVKFEWR